MNFKKYNFILVFMLALVIAIPIVSLSSHSNSSSADVSDDLPPVVEVDPSDQQTSSKPTTYKFNTAWQAYNHILNSTLTQSYVAETNQSLKATANVGISMSFDQSVYCKAYVTKDGKILEETYSSGTKKFFNTTFYDGESVYTKTVDGTYQAGKQPNVVPDKYSKSAYLNENGIMPAYVMKLNSKCFSGLKPKRESNGYYSFTVNVSDSSLWQDYLKKVEKLSGSEKFPTMNAISMRFVYSSKTGKLVQLKLTESYDIKYMGLDVTCSSTTVKTFSSVGGDVQLPNMNYMGV